MKRDFQEKFFRYLGIFCAVVCLGIGLLGLLGWHGHREFFLKILSESEAIQYAGVLFFLIAGIELFLRLFWSQGSFYFRMLSIPIAIVGFLTFFDFLFQAHFEINRRVLKLFLNEKALEVSVRGSFLFSIVMILYGIATFLTRRNETSENKNKIRVFLGLCILCVGVVGLFGFLLSIQTRFLYSPENLDISFLASVGSFFLGLGIFAIAFYDNLRNQGSFKKIKIPLTVFVIFFFFVLMMRGWYVDEIDKLIHRVSAQTILIQGTILERIATDKEIGEILLKELEKEKDQKFSLQWQETGQPFLRNNPEIQEFYLLDHSFQTLANFSWPAVSEKPLVLSKETKAFVLKHLLKETFLLRYEPNFGFLFFFPMEAEQTAFFVMRAGVQTFLSQVFIHIGQEECSVKFWINQSLIFEINPSKERFPEYAVEKNILETEVFLFRVEAEPSPALVANSLSYGMFFYILFAGLALSFFGGIVVYWIEKVRKNVLQLTAVQSTLSEYKERLDIAIRGSRMSAWIYDFQKDELFWDEYAYSYFFGKTKEFILPKTLNEFLQYVFLEDRKALIEEILASKMQREFVFSLSFRMVYSSKKVRFFLLRAATFFDQQTGAVKLAGVCWDVSEETKKQKILELQFSLTKLLNDLNQEEIVPKLLRTLGEGLDLSVVILWERDPKTNTLICKNFWNNPKIETEEFQETCKVCSFKEGETFPGRVWQAKKPLWIENLVTDPQFLRLNFLLKSNVKSVFGFPIMDEEEFYGVIEFFKMTPFLDEVAQYYLKFGDFVSTALMTFFRRQQEETERSQLASIVNFARETIVSQDLEGKITTWNQGAEQMLGYSSEEILGKSIEILFFPEQREDVSKILESMRNGIPVQNFETVFMRKDEKKIPVLMTFSPMRKKNLVVGSCLITQDITQIKEFEKSLKKNEEKFRVFVETTNDWIWAIDKNRKITFSNPGVHAILGYQVEEVLGVDLLLFTSDEERSKNEQELKDFFEKKRGWMNLLIQRKHKSSGVRWLESTSQPILDEKGTLLGYRGAERDITERKNLENIKTEFISVVSHELRTPLTSIRGALGLLLSKKIPQEKVDQLLNIASNNCERLMQIINDILEIQKIEAGRLQIHLVTVDVEKVVKDAIESNHSFADKFGTELVLEEGAQNVKIFSDPDRLIQILTNLISNAVKFSPPRGKVFLKVDASPTSVRFSVRDLGVGIPPDIQGHIFEKFFRGSTGEASAIPGTGLGLSICKNLIERLGGTISFITQVGKGSTFYFDLPRWHEMVPSLKPVQLKEFLPPLLICSEDQMLIVQLQEAAKQNEFLNEVFYSPGNILNEIRKKDYSAIFLDLMHRQLHEIDFLEQLYRTKEYAALPLFLIAGPEIQKELKDPVFYQNVPVLTWLEKPLDFKKLDENIKKIKTKIFEKKPKILYVEHDLDLIAIVKSILQEKVQVLVATTISEARELLKKENIDLLLLDVFMPDGLGPDLLPAKNEQTGEEIAAIIFSVSKEIKTYPSSVKQVLIKQSTTNQELIDSVLSHIPKKIEGPDAK